MKTLIMAILVSQLTACGVIGYIYDSNDRCQNISNQPSYCGASSGTMYTTRDWRTGNYQSYTTKGTR